MNIKLGMARLALARGEWVRLDNARGALIRCAEGLLWVTQHNDLQDYFLSPGETLRIEGKGTTLIYAMRPAAFGVGTATPAKADEEKTWWNAVKRSVAAPLGDGARFFQAS